MTKKKTIKFSGSNENNFFQTLRERVNIYFEANNLSPNNNGQMIIKTIVLLSAYIIPYVIILSLQLSFPMALVCWFIMGCALAGIGMSVMHDANHGAYSSNATTNKWIGHTLNLLGGSVHNWKIQHNVLHHTYTNVAGVDEDIADRIVLKFNPHTKVKWFHKFQTLYVFFFYGLLTFYWVILKDFIQFKQFRKSGVSNQSKFEYRKLVFFTVVNKSVYLFMFLIFPVWIINMSFMEIFTGFALMHFTGGIILSCVFQLAHTVEDTSHPLPDESGLIDNDWAVHQLETTVNFSRHSKFVSWYVGGLNYQIEHHLFPKVCHVHYPALSRIVEQTAKEFNLPYKENKTFGLALRSHLTALKRFGRLQTHEIIN